jgi:hypothetical protein
MYKFIPRSTKWLILSISVASLVFAFTIFEPGSNEVYFSLISRSWELGAGAVIASWRLDSILSNSKRQDLLSDILALIGLGIVLTVMFTINSETLFPSPIIVLAIFGVMLVIAFSREQSLAGKILTNKAFIFVGTISFGLYVWHQPVLSVTIQTFELFGLTQSIQMLGTALALGITLVATVLTYKFIELPFHKTLFSNVSAKSVIIYGIASLCVVAMVGVGITQNASNSASHVIQGTTYEPAEQSTCPSFTFSSDSTECAVYGTGKELIVVWGDSHAKRLITSPPDDLLLTDRRVMVIGTLACPPVLNSLRIDTENGDSKCDDPTEMAAQLKYIANQQPERVILIARWSMYTEGYQIRNVLQKNNHYLSRGSVSSDKDASRIALRNGLSDTISALTNLANTSNITIVEQAPEFQSVSDAERNAGKTIDINTISKWHKSEEQIISSVAKLSNKVTVLNTREAFCSKEECKSTINGEQLYFDTNHLSVAGEQIIWNLLLKD